MDGDVTIAVDFQEHAFVFHTQAIKSSSVTVPSLIFSSMNTTHACVSGVYVLKLLVMFLVWNDMKKLVEM